MRRTVILLLGLFLLFPLSLSANPNFFLLKDLRRGQIGVGYSDFGNGRVEKFTVEIIGPTAHPLQDDATMVLVKMRGQLAPYALVGGISGSPIYVKGKLLGALALGFGTFAVPSIGGVIPIDHMRHGSTKSSRFKSYASQQPDAAPLLRISSNFSAAEYEPLREIFPANKWAIQTFRRGKALGPVSVKSSEKIGPGSSINVALVEGDVNFTANGTVTYLDYGGTILAFGHAFLGMGETVRAPVYAAHVLYSVKSPRESFKMVDGNKQFIGAMVNDNDFGITIAPLIRPAMLPVDFDLEEDGEKTAFHFQTVRHPFLSPLLVRAGLASLLGRLPKDKEGYYQLEGTIELENLPAVRWVKNVTIKPKLAVSPEGPPHPFAAIQDFFFLLANLERSEFQQVKVKRVRFSAKVSPLPDTYMLGSVLMLNADGKATAELKLGEKFNLLLTLRNDDFSKNYLIKHEFVLPADLVFNGKADDKQEIQIFITSGDNYAEKDSALVGTYDSAPHLVDFLNRQTDKGNNKIFIQIVFPSEKEESSSEDDRLWYLDILPDGQWEIDTPHFSSLQEKSVAVAKKRVFKKVVSFPENVMLIANKQLTVTLLPKKDPE